MRFPSKFALCLAVVTGCCLSSPAFGDELQYVPGGATVVMSLEMSKFVKSTLYQEMKKRIPAFEKEFEKNLGEETGISLSNMARMSMGVALGDKGEQEAGIITTIKPVTAAEIKKNKRIRSYQKNPKYEEVKIGDFTVHELTYQFQFDPNGKPGKVEHGEGFCIVENNIVLYGRLPSLKKNLERKQKELSDNVQAGLKIAGISSPAVLIIDVGNMPARQRKDMVRGLGVEEAEDIISKNVRVLVLKGDEKDGKFQGSAAVICKDSVADVKKAVDTGLATVRKHLMAADDPNLPAEFRDAAKQAVKVLDSIKVATAGDRVTGTLTAEPVMLAQVMNALMMPRKAEAKRGSR